jgi:hypothetical protein
MNRLYRRSAEEQVALVQAAEIVAMVPPRLRTNTKAQKGEQDSS